MGNLGIMRYDEKTLMRLAENRERRLRANGRPKFGLTMDEAEASARSAMRLAQASKSQVERRMGCRRPVAA